MDGDSTFTQTLYFVIETNVTHDDLESDSGEKDDATKKLIDVCRDRINECLTAFNISADDIDAKTVDPHEPEEGDSTDPLSKNVEIIVTIRGISAVDAQSIRALLAESFDRVYELDEEDVDDDESYDDEKDDPYDLLKGLPWRDGRTTEEK
jgi:hypothetical protein